MPFIKNIVVQKTKTLAAPVIQYSLWGWGDGTVGQTDNDILTYVPYPVDNGTTWVSGSGGASHTMAIKTDGTLWGWGANAFGQLGDRTVINRSSPVQIGTLTNWLKISRAGNTTLSIKTDGALWAWGSNASGQLGDGTVINRSSPVQIGTLTNWASVSGTVSHTMAIKTDGTLWGWGLGSSGQIGDGTIISRSSPVQIGTLTNWASVSANSLYSMAIKTDGTLWGWGLGTSGQLGDNTALSRSSPVQIGTLTNWASVTGGSGHTMAIKTDGTLWGWGANTSGQIGDGTTTTKFSPVQIGTLTNWASVIASGNPGGNHTISIKTDGTLWVWGNSTSGQLGDGTTNDRSSPVQIGTLTNWASVSAGSSHTIAIKTDGTIYTWGAALSGQLGYTMQRSSPVQIGDGYSWSNIDAGRIGTSAGLHTMGVKTNGTLWGWGGNPSGQLGDGTLIFRSSPVQIGTLTNWSSVECGTDSSFGLKTDNTLWGWGYNVNFELGDGTSTSKSSPVQIGSLSWKKVSAGAAFTVAISSDDKLQSWGSTSAGKLGFGFNNSPVQLNSTYDWSSAAASAGSIIGLKTNGTLWSWGSNTQGELGLNDTITRSSPVQIGTDVNWYSIDMGFEIGSTSVGAIKTDGTLWTWGNGGSGQLGHSNTANRSSPVQVGTLTSWSKISVGTAWMMASRTDGTLWVWGGSPNFGQLGQNNTSTFSSPVQIGTLNTWSQIAAGRYSAFAIKTDGTLWSWGLNTSGELGDGTVINRSSPVQIGTLTNWSKIYAGGDSTSAGSTIAIKTDGTLWMWGRYASDGTTVSRSSPVQIGTLTNWLSASSGGNVSNFAIKTNGTLWTLTSFSNGDTGDGTYNGRSSPVQIGTLTSWSFALATSSTGYAIKTDGSLWGWGGNVLAYYPKVIHAQNTSNIIRPCIIDVDNWGEVSAGASYSMAIKTDGTLWGWGRNGNGQLGDNTTTTRSQLVQIGNLTDWSKVSAGDSHTMAIKTDGTLWSWGTGTSGQLGLESTTPSWTIDRGTNWATISGGATYTLAVKTDGTLWSWGNGLLGRLGTGNTTSRSSPTQIGTLTNWSSVSAGFGNNLALKTDGTMWGWGQNANGEIGDFTLTSRSSPVQVGLNASNWLSVSMGSNHGVGIKTDYTIWSWGVNSSGQLGDGTTTSTSFPAQIGTGTDWSKVSCGQNHTIAIKTDGTLWAWGGNSVGQLGDNNSPFGKSSPVQIGTLTNWSSVSAGSNNSLAIKSDGTLWAWGSNTNGRLGITTPVLPIKLDSGANWSTAGLSSHSMVVKTDGTLWGWGLNSNGQLGLNDTINRSSPVQIGTDTNWSTVAANSGFTLAIKTDGTLWSWGQNSNGQLGQTISTGINRSSPVQVGTLTNWSKISIGPNFATSIKTDGTLWVWGSNGNAQLGLNNFTQHSSPVQVGTDTNWSSISAGGNAFCVAIKTDGTLWSWGNNTNAELGQNNTISRSSPVQIGTDVNWSRISAGASVTLAIKTDGTLWGWGANAAYSQIGDGTSTTRSSPVQVGTLTNWSSISVGGQTSTALKTDGTLWTWGGGSNGEFGDGTFTSPRNSPVQVGTRTDWKSVFAAGSVPTSIYHVMAIDTSNNLYGWGINTTGQLGLNNVVSYNSTGYSSPIQVGTLTNWASVSANGGSGGSHTIAVKTDGTLWGWGGNPSAQLGDGTLVTRSSPVQIGTLTNWSRISAGGGHSISIKTDGTLRAWGGNTNGELGRGFIAGPVSRSSPVQLGEDQWTSVYAENSNTMAIRSDGTLWGWGLNTAGYIGDGTVISRSYPVQIGTYSKWKQVSSGASHTVAIREE
jgi:alpha-tubulin suppressor-like RCC1 family protein